MASDTDPTADRGVSEVISVVLLLGAVITIGLIGFGTITTQINQQVTTGVEEQTLTGVANLQETITDTSGIVRSETVLIPYEPTTTTQFAKQELEIFVQADDTTADRINTEAFIYDTGESVIYQAGGVTGIARAGEEIEIAERSIETTHVSDQATKDTVVTITFTSITAPEEFPTPASNAPQTDEIPDSIETETAARLTTALPLQVATLETRQTVIDSPSNIDITAAPPSTDSSGTKARYATEIAQLWEDALKDFDVESADTLVINTVTSELSYPAEFQSQQRDQCNNVTQSGSSISTKETDETIRCDITAANFDPKNQPYNVDIDEVDFIGDILLETNNIDIDESSYKGVVRRAGNIKTSGSTVFGDFEGERINTDESRISGSLEGITITGSVSSNKVVLDETTVTDTVDADGRVDSDEAIIKDNLNSGDGVNLDGSTVEGSVTAGGKADLDEAILKDNLNSGDKVSLDESTVEGSVTADGKADVDGGTIGADLNTGDKVSLDEATVKGSVTADGKADVDGATIQSDLDASQKVSLDGATIEGSVTADGKADVDGATIQSDLDASQKVSLDGATIEGSVTADGKADLDGGKIKDSVDIDGPVDSDGTVIEGDLNASENAILDGATVKGSVFADQRVSLDDATIKGALVVFKEVVADSDDIIKSDGATIEGDIYINKKDKQNKEFFECDGASINGQSCNEYEVKSIEERNE